MKTIIKEEAKGGLIESVRIPVEKAYLEGELGIPPGARGVVLFAHGSGSSRHSPRNQFVARTIRESGTGTLLFDLLTREEDHVDKPVRGHPVFIVQSMSPPVTENVFQLLLFVDACRRAAAGRVTAIVPYLGYARADKRHARREARLHKQNLPRLGKFHFHRRGPRRQEVASKGFRMDRGCNDRLRPLRHHPRAAHLLKGQQNAGLVLRPIRIVHSCWQRSLACNFSSSAM